MGYRMRPAVFLMLWGALLAGGCGGPGEDAGGDTLVDVRESTDALDSGAHAVDAAPDRLPLDGVTEVEAGPPDSSHVNEDAAVDVPLRPWPGAETPYLVGAARREITPAEPVMLAGYGPFTGGLDNCRWSEGVHDSLWVNAVAIADAATGEFVVLLALDSVGLMWPDVVAIRQGFARAVEASTGYPVAGDRLVVAATHGESTPDTVGLWGSVPDESGRIASYVELLIGEASAAAGEAYLALEEARLRFAQGTHENTEYVTGMAHDPTLSYLVAERTDGSAIGTWTVWAAHAVVYGRENNAITADFVGPFRYRLAEELGDVPHLFFQGAVGGVQPIREGASCTAVDPFPDGYRDPEISDGNRNMAACVGFDLADAVLALDAVATDWEDGGLSVRETAFAFTGGNMLFSALSRSGMIARTFPPVGEPMETHFTKLALGPITAITAPGEAFPSYANGLREAAIDQGADPSGVVVVGLGTDWLGYLLTPEQWADEDYGYHRGLCPGSDVLPGQQEALRRLLGAP